MAAEIGATFDIETALTRGLLPIVYAALDPEGTLRSYVGLYIREEVQAEALVRNVGDFARFLEAASLSHAAILNLSEVARECQVSRKTAEGFLPILEDLLLGFRVPVFARRAKRRLVIHSKFFFADTGVFRSLRPRGPLDTPEEIGGAALEGLVAQHLRAWIAYTRETHALHYWRTRAGLEVDFVVYGDATFVALEVKSSRDVSSRDVRSLRAFLDEYPEAKACLLYRGRERIRVNGILCVPCEEFLSRLVPDATLPVE
jgi:predicted AAA+ superfamily ATPase